MARRLLLFTFSLPLAPLLFGQVEQPADTLAAVGRGPVEQPADTLAAVRRTFIPSIYIDHGKLVTLPSEMETKYEGGIELLFLEKYPLIVEVGSATLSPDQAYSNGTYESTGMYYRVGTGIYSQFLPKNKLGVTLRYGMSTFDETSKITLESPSGVQGPLIELLDRRNLTASWIEAVIYSDRKLNDLLSIGINIRLRVLRDYDRQEPPVDVYAIPGYGRSFDHSVPAINLFLKVSF